MPPILYSFRRCPYAIRARYTLAYAGIEWEHREILLRAKPPEMLAISPKGTVPVLQLADGRVIDESYEIMLWALEQSNPDQWSTDVGDWVELNDTRFKSVLDSYKYPEGPSCSQEEYRLQGEEWLLRLESAVANGSILDAPSVADAALFPFIRQFRGVDIDWFDQAPYPHVQKWLRTILQSDLFQRVMIKQDLYS